MWDRREDKMWLEWKNQESLTVVSKRTILSVVSRVYDPIGFLCPVLLKPKKMLQRAWLAKRSWDEALKEELISEFKTCQDAYAAVVYLRTQGIDGVSMQLIQAKARVASIKKVYRLELFGCVIAVRLAINVKISLELEEVPTFYWTDSATAMAWIRRNDLWGTLVGNRVKEILSCSNVENWRHVPRNLNPTDLPSRGCTAKQLRVSRWWMGTAWLRNGPQDWQFVEEKPNEEVVASEKKKATFASMINVPKEPMFGVRLSTFEKNVRALAYILRIAAWCKAPKNSRLRLSDELTTEELKKAELRLMWLVQQELFETVGASFHGLEILLGKDELVRVKTKLVHRDDSVGLRFSILLPGGHPIFNPASAPWWGGFWERLIRSIKDLLKRILGRASLSYTELMTCVVDVEAVINQRPLTCITEDSEDLIPLTPAMFLCEISEVSVPDLDQLEKSGLRGRYRHLARVREMLKERFRKEYRAELVHRGKLPTSRPVKPGDVVLIGSDNRKRLEWSLGRVLRLLPGRDGIPRLVQLKLSSGELIRPIQRLYLLEADPVILEGDDLTPTVKPKEDAEDTKGDRKKEAAGVIKVDRKKEVAEVTKDNRKKESAGIT
ncbi:uncharacterized protein [Temnothorax nylanderi]|uniref:uncharacterized protein n=1 Tax=Temnothorax nylanderi TaxID=102681 RepID=UPI003A8769C4